MVTREEFGTAYQDGRKRTVGFLLSRGLPEHEATETAQAAWARGWERRHQIRDARKTLTWVNSIALNMYRTGLRRESNKQEFQDLPVPPQPNLAAIDAWRMLKRCNDKDRSVLEKRYLHGYDIHDIAREHRCSETAVRVRLMRARRSLRRQFDRRPVLCAA